MNADYQHLNLSAENDLVRAFWVRSPVFGFHWHYHPELEITWVKHGRGMRMVGDSVHPFEAGDFVFLGGNLPHTWISDDDFNNSQETMEVGVLQFHPSLFSGKLIHLSGMRRIQRLLENAGRGIQVSMERRTKAADLLSKMIEAEGFAQLSLFLSLLDYLGETPEFHLLASKAYVRPLNNATEERILTACRYVHDHFMKPIKLETVSHLCHMNPSAFCRFFRKTTGQTFFEYINDLRIGKACNLLLANRDLHISEIAYMSGFSSQTLFNRIFMRKKHMTPSSFRKMAIS